MPIENDDPFSQLSEQGGLKPNANDHDDIEKFAKDDYSNPEHSDDYDHDVYAKTGGHFSGEEEDPEKDALRAYSKTVGGWFLSDEDEDEKDSSPANKNKIQDNKQNNTTNQNTQNNLTPAQQEQLRHQQNMNRMEETNKGLQTSKNMISTFQENAQTAIGINPEAAKLFRETQTDLRNYLEALKTELLTEHNERVKSTPDESAEAVIKLGWLQGRIRKAKETYEGYEKKAKNWALIFRLMSSILAAVVTVLLGLNVTDYMKSYGIDWFVNFFALVISAFISIIGVIQGFYDANELYAKYTDTANKLDELVQLIEYLDMSQNYLTIRQVNLIYKAYDKIISMTDDYETLITTQREDGKSR
ncbi:MAG: DUF4231 domain-containing protein [Bacteroidetes bacterium]|nr:MAG: DUF4231 domain-containing protein [Bacteroidota bacterium]